jgi:cell shape-determining protein MreC
MNYRQPSNGGRLLRFAYFLAAVLLLLFLFPYIGGIFEVPQKAIVSLLRPLWEEQNGADRRYSPIAYFISKKKLLEENEDLREQIKKYENVTFIDRILREENEELKERLGRPNFKSTRMLAAVLVRPGRTPYDTLILDIGKEDGVNEKDKVLACDNILIGEIVDVSEHESRARLYSSPGVITNVSVGAQNINAEAKGLGNGNYEILLPRELGVVPGDAISVPNIELFVMGVVRDIEAGPADAFKRILFKMPINMQELKFIEILTS